MCSFCLAEWQFRRILCPGCGEEDHAKLPVFTATELAYMTKVPLGTVKGRMRLALEKLSSYLQGRGLVDA